MSNRPAELFQIVEVEDGPGGLHWGKQDLQWHIDSGVLVPVKPDYKSAWAAFVANENHEPTECACQCEHTTERAVQAAVDAAYGGRR